MSATRRRRPPNPAPSPPHARAEEPAARVLRRFRLVFNAVKSHFQQVERQAGIGGAQVWALSVIAAQPDIGISGLARAMDIHQTTASNLIKSLAGQDMVMIKRNGVDRRTVQLRLLPAGMHVLRTAPGPFSGVLPEALSQLDRQTLARLEHDLAQLVDMLQADGAAAGIPLAQI